jgi:acylphosphatase
VNKVVEFQVHGRVQGVGFREFTRRAAARAGVNGWVRNEPDRSVRGHVEGPVEAVDQFLEAIGRGPPPGYVSRVDVIEGDAEGAAGFRIRD